MQMAVFENHRCIGCYYLHYYHYYQNNNNIQYIDFTFLISNNQVITIITIIITC